MLVRAIGNSIKHLRSEAAVSSYRRNIHLDEVSLEVGRRYNVFGVSLMKGSNVPWFLVCEEDADEYPVPHLGEFFDLIDCRIPIDWCFSMEQNNVGQVSLLPKRWAEDPAFLEKLVDGEKAAIADFARMKSLLPPRAP